MRIKKELLAMLSFLILIVAIIIDKGILEKLEQLMV